MREVNRGDVHWWVSEPSKSEFSFWTEFQDPEIAWEQWTLDMVDRYVTRGSVMLDCGAWSGPVSMWAADRHGARVIAVEPDPVANDYLNLNVAVNGFSDRITIVDGAIANHTGTTHLAPHEFGWGSTMSHLADEGREVACWTAPDLLAAQGVSPLEVSLVKCDIEGGEAIVMEHVAPFFAEHRVPMIVAMHEPWWPRRMDPAWFDGYDLNAALCGWHSVLCTPKG